MPLNKRSPHDKNMDHYIYFVCLIMLAVLYVALSCSSVLADNPSSQPTFLSQGLVVATMKSAKPDLTRRYGIIVEYKVENVLRPIPGDNELKPKSVVEELVALHRSRVGVGIELQVFSSNNLNKLVLGQVVKSDGILELINKWELPPHSLEQVITVEKSGVTDIAHIERVESYAGHW